ncbi:MAG: uracil-DNA glycosylase [Clostridia bacterium]
MQNFKDILEEEFKKEYYICLNKKLDEMYEDKNICILPERKDIFNVFKYTSFKDVKVCIIGQDPYPTKNVAHGLAFSVKPGVKVPESLKNIYKELQNEGEYIVPNHGCLIDWAKQGVLLLNTVLTVEEGKPDSHKDLGWQNLTTSVIMQLNKNKENLVYMLWGAKARKLKKYITNTNHLVLESVHPSPLSVYRGYIGCNHFMLANEYLKQNGLQMVKWQLPLDIKESEEFINENK